MVRGPISMAIAGALMMAMLALTMGGPRVLEKVLPESVLAWIDDNDGFGGLLSLSGTVNMMDAGSGGGGGNSEDPMSHLRDTNDGWKASAKIAALPQGRAAFVKDVIDGRRAPNGGTTAPDLVDVLQPMEGCSFAAPGAGTLVGHVSTFGDSEIRLDLATYGDQDLAAAVRQLASVYRKSGRKQVQGLGDLRFTALDVAVTETEKPVYLVLQASGGTRLLWNIHLAPGAQVERVVLLGGEQAGVTNLDPAVPVDVLRNGNLGACGVPLPVYPLNAGHMLFQSLEAGILDADEADQTLGKIKAANAAWDGWFRTTFGVSANETMAGNWRNGSIAVVGPVPAAPEGRAVFAAIKGSTARITTDTYVEYPALAAEGADFASRVVAIATAFAWGNLDNIKPEVSF